MNHNYHMAQFTAQERIQTRRNDAQIHRALQAAGSQNTSAGFSLRFNRLYQQMTNWNGKLADLLATWQPSQAFRNLIYKHS